MLDVGVEWGAHRSQSRKMPAWKSVMARLRAVAPSLQLDVSSIVNVVVPEHWKSLLV